MKGRTPALMLCTLYKALLFLASSKYRQAHLPVRMGYYENSFLPEIR